MKNLIKILGLTIIVMFSSSFDISAQNTTNINKSNTELLNEISMKQVDVKGGDNYTRSLIKNYNFILEDHLKQSIGLKSNQQFSESLAESISKEIADIKHTVETLTSSSNLRKEFSVGDVVKRQKRGIDDSFLDYIKTDEYNNVTFKTTTKDIEIPINETDILPLMLQGIDPTSTSTKSYKIEKIKITHPNDDTPTNNFLTQYLAQTEKNKVFQQRIFIMLNSHPDLVFNLFLLMSENVFVKLVRMYEVITANIDNIKIKKDVIIEAKVEKQIKALEREMNNALLEIFDDTFPSLVSGIDSGLGSYSDTQIQELANKIFVSTLELQNDNLKEKFKLGLFFLNRAVLGLDTIKQIYFPLLKSKQKIKDKDYYLVDNIINPLGKPSLSDCLYLAYGSSSFNATSCRPREFFRNIDRVVTSYETFIKAFRKHIDFTEFYLDIMNYLKTKKGYIDEYNALLEKHAKDSRFKDLQAYTECMIKEQINFGRNGDSCKSDDITKKNYKDLIERFSRDEVVKGSFRSDNDDPSGFYLYRVHVEDYFADGSEITLKYYDEASVLWYLYKLKGNEDKEFEKVILVSYIRSMIKEASAFKEVYDYTECRLKKDTYGHANCSYSEEDYINAKRYERFIYENTDLLGLSENNFHNKLAQEYDEMWEIEKIKRENGSWDNSEERDPTRTVIPPHLEFEIKEKIVDLVLKTYAYRKYYEKNSLEFKDFFTYVVKAFSKEPNVADPNYELFLKYEKALEDFIEHHNDLTTEKFQKYDPSKEIKDSALEEFKQYVLKLYIYDKLSGQKDDKILNTLKEFYSYIENSQDTNTQLLKWKWPLTPLFIDVELIEDSIVKLSDYLISPQSQMELYILAHAFYQDKYGMGELILNPFDDISEYHLEYYESMVFIRNLFIDKVIRVFDENDTYKNDINNIMAAYDENVSDLFRKDVDKNLESSVVLQKRKAKRLEDESLAILRRDLDKIVPETLKSFSPFYDKDCMNFPSMDWTKEVTSDSFGKTRHKLEVNPTNTSRELRKTNVATYMKNDISPVVRPLFPEREVRVFRTEYQSDDNVSLMARSLFSAMKLIYANYVQYTSLLGPEKDNLNLENIDFVITEDEKIYNSDPYNSGKKRTVKFPEFETLKTFYQALFLENLGLATKKDLTQEKEGANEAVTYAYNKKIIDNVFKENAIRIQGVREKYAKNLEKTRDQVLAIDEKIKKLKDNDIRKLIQSIKEYKLLIDDQEYKPWKDYKEDFKDAVLPKLPFNIINPDDRKDKDFWRYERKFTSQPVVYTSSPGSLSPAGQSTEYNGYEYRPSMDEALTKALEAYMHKAYPNNEDFVREWDLRKGHLFTEEEVLYAWFYYIISNGDTKRASKIYTKAEIEKMYPITDKDSNENSNKMKNLKKYNYNTYIISSIYAREGLLNPILTIDVLSEFEQTQGNSEYFSVRRLADESKKFLFGNKVGGRSPLELASNLDYQLDKQPEVGFMPHKPNDPYLPRDYVPSYYKIGPANIDFKFIARNGNQLTFDIFSSIFLTHPLTLLQTRQSIAGLEKSRDMLLFTMAPVKHVYETSFLSSETSGDWMISSYVNFLTRELEKYEGYIKKYNDYQYKGDISSRSDLHKDLKDIIIPNTVLMTSVMEEYPQYKKQVCSLQKERMDERATTDRWIRSAQITSFILFLIPTKATLIMGSIGSVAASIWDIYVQNKRQQIDGLILRNAVNLSIATDGVTTFDAYQNNKVLMDGLRQQYKEQVERANLSMMMDVIDIAITFIPVGKKTSELVLARGKRTIDGFKEFGIKLGKVGGKGWVVAGGRVVGAFWSLVREEAECFYITSKFSFRQKLLPFGKLGLKWAEKRNIKWAEKIISKWIKGIEQGSKTVAEYNLVAATAYLALDAWMIIHMAPALWSCGNKMWNKEKPTTRELVYSLPLLLGSMPSIPIFLGDQIFLITPTLWKIGEGKNIQQKLEKEAEVFRNFDESLLLQDGIFRHVIDDGITISSNPNDLSTEDGDKAIQIIGFMKGDDEHFVQTSNEDGTLKSGIQSSQNNIRGAKVSVPALVGLERLQKGMIYKTDVNEIIEAYTNAFYPELHQDETTPQQRNSGNTEYIMVGSEFMSTESFK